MKSTILKTRDNQTYPSHSIRTFTGKVFDVINPTKEMIDIIDIAHSLSLQCRFCGHTSRHVSIAEHSLWVADHVPNELKLAALLHDASEAYLVDVPTPIKNMLPAYRVMEKKLMTLIFEKYNAGKLTDVIDYYDKVALQHEWDTYIVELLPKQEAKTHLYWEQLFLMKFYTLT